MIRRRKAIVGVAATLLLLTGLSAWFVSAHPLVFNESFFGHAHCIACVYTGLGQYAAEHGGAYPVHTNGYADALAMIYGGTWMLTGPGYTERLPDEVKQSDIPESKCGRVYVQGLSKGCDPHIAFVFDKKATPGGDHCHGFNRLRAPLGREVVFVGEGLDFIPCSEWTGFASNQIDRLVAGGMPRVRACWYYDQVDK